MIEKILERLEKLKEKHGCDTITCAECERRYGYDCARNESKITIDLCKEIVQEVAKEYGKDTNVPSNGWIPCSERLPEDKREVLVWNSDQKMHCVDWYHAQTKNWYSNDFGTEDSKYIVVWCELPAPYQKGE